MANTIYYRTKDGLSDYKFSFEKLRGGRYRAYIISMPSYGLRNTGLLTTHRLTDWRGRYYICWDTPIYDEAELRSVVALWSDLTQHYIRTGITIDEQMQ